MKITKGKPQNIGHCNNCSEMSKKGVLYQIVYQIEIGNKNRDFFFNFRLCGKCLYDLKDVIQKYIKKNLTK